MKVLKTGEENSKLWKIEDTCTGKGWDQGSNVPCGASLEISALDIQYRTHADYSGYTDTYYGFICPICKCFTEISTNDIPKYVLNSATKCQKPKDDSDK